MVYTKGLFSVTGPMAPLVTTDTHRFASSLATHPGAVPYQQLECP